MEQPFWKTKSLEEMSRSEWESICDHCGQCCLQKLEDEDTGEIAITAIVCRYSDPKTCRCTEYENRSVKVPECLQLTPQLVRELKWLPRTCSYKVLAETGELASWHPLVCGSSEGVHQTGHSVQGQSISEELVAPDNWEEHIIDWVEL